MLNSGTTRPIFIAAVVTAIAGQAQAQGDPQRTATAMALYDQAAEAMEKGDYAAACPKLEEAARLEPAAIGAKMTLAQCYEKAGRLASAWTAYVVAEEAAAKAGQMERQKRAHERAEALRPRLAQLTLAVPDDLKALADLEILRDGIPVGPAQWDAPVPVDPS